MVPFITWSTAASASAKRITGFLYTGNLTIEEIVLYVHIAQTRLYNSLKLVQFMLNT